MSSEYRVRLADRRGTIREEIREADSEESLLQDVSNDGLFPLQVQRLARAERSPGGRRVSKRGVLEFTQGMGLLLRSGLTLRDALEIGETALEGGEAHELAASLLRQIRKGASLSDVVAKMPRAFPPVYRGLVRIGERIGSLDDVFVRLAKYLEDAKLLREKLVGAMLYPLLVLSIAAAGVLMVILVVIPNVGRMFDEFGQGLPQRITDVTRGMHTAVWFLGSLVAAGVGAGVTTVAARSRSARAAVAVDRLLANLPVVGRAILGREMLAFTFAMQTLTESGVQVEDALEEAAAVMGNAFLRRELSAVRERVLRGDRLSAAFAAYPAFPRRLASWVAIGERTGSVGEVFGQIRGYYQAEVEKWSTRFMSLVEPALIVLVGLVVVFIVLVFIVPLFSLYGSIL